MTTIPCLTNSHRL